MHKTPVSLRERNRLDTWALIHDQASSLACEHGLANTTVEAISEAAGVSKRTFFNYFPTKEDAILGVQAPTLSRKPSPTSALAGPGTSSDGRSTSWLPSSVPCFPRPRAQSGA